MIDNSSERLKRRAKQQGLPKIWRGEQEYIERTEENALVLGERLNDSVIEKLSEEQLAVSLKMGPQFCYRHNLLEGDGWRAGYTKPTIEDRVYKNRKKEKNRRKAWRKNLDR